MKFACDRCGKRYASVDEPAVGRVYRIRCRCGHVIVVRAPGAAPRRDAGEAQRSHDLPPAFTVAGEKGPSPPPLRVTGAWEGQPAPLPPAGEDEPLPPPLVEASGEDPVSGFPPAGEDSESAEPRADAAPARVGAAGAEPPFGDDPFLRAARSAAPEAAHEGSRNHEGWGASPPGRDDGVLTDPGGAAALSLGLDDDGAAGARWRALRVAIVLALVGLAGALAMWRG